jgi:hypothetical protein
LIRWTGALVLAALLPVLPGCFLFGGSDDKEEEKKQGESLMDASTGVESGAAPAPGAAEDRGPSQALPILALVVSGITLVSLIVHSRRRRRHPDPGW